MQSLPAHGVVRLRTQYYRQSDADFKRDVPAEGYGGWSTAQLPLSLDHTAVAVMHAWDCGTREEYPGWHRAIEYIPRAERICRTVFPPLLEAVRRSPLKLFHVVGGGDYYRHLDAFRRVARPAKDPGPPTPKAEPDEAYRELRAFEFGPGKYGQHNREDIRRGFKRLDFAAEAMPRKGEGIAEDAPQLLALCQASSVNHLIYMGFAVNWCLQLSPGGMADMSRHGILCSVLRQAVTAVENRETAREELAKEIGLWKVARLYGFVYDVDDFVKAIF